MSVKRISDFGIHTGKMKRGRLNKITDVDGVLVGHHSVDTNEHKTGCTVIIPGTPTPFKDRPVCSSFVINGYGKTTGLVQIDELGELESPIVLTNTLNVGLMQDSLVEYTLQRCNEDGFELTSFNPVVAECNDSFLNNIAERVLNREHLFKAFEDARLDFEEGDVGAGKGMSCYQLKGGIGSASRLIEYDAREYVLGALVLSNHGLLEDLIIEGKTVGKRIKEEVALKKEIDEGSIITLIATDVPLSARQLTRLCKRAQNGIARTGSFTSHGSGEIVIAFSTGNLNKEKKGAFERVLHLREDRMDSLFEAVSESVEEAILNSMICANDCVGYKGNSRMSLKRFASYL